MRDPFSTVLTVTPPEALDTLEKCLGISGEELAQALESERRSALRRGILYRTGHRSACVQRSGEPDILAIQN
jgi:hypothetical protein